LANFTSERINSSSRLIRDAVELGSKNYHIHALVELDITNARKHLKEHSREGNRLSLTSYIIKACALAVKEDVSIQSFATRSKTITPQDVDFWLPIETKTNDVYQLTNMLIRSTDAKSIGEIDNRLKDLRPSLSDNELLFAKLPTFLRKFLYAFWLRSPKHRQAYFGTLYFSSIMNYSADRRTWGIPLPFHSLGIFIGTASKRLVQTKVGTEERDVLQVTVSCDHRVNNGGDMGRFVHRLKHQLENVNLLDDEV